MPLTPSKRRTCEDEDEEEEMQKKLTYWLQGSVF